MVAITRLIVALHTPCLSCNKLKNNVFSRFRANIGLYGSCSKFENINVMQFFQAMVFSDMYFVCFWQQKTVSLHNINVFDFIKKVSVFTARYEL